MCQNRSCCTILAGRPYRGPPRVALSTTGGRLIAVAFAAHFFLIARASLVADDKISLETIRAAMREHVSSVTSISTKYSLSYKPGSAPVHREPFHAQAWGPQQYQWADQGPQKLLTFGPVVVNDEMIGPPWWVSHDGTTGYTANYDPADSSRIVLISETPEVDPFFYFDQTPGEFAGLRVPHSESKLPDLLAGAEVRVDGVETINGSECWKIDVGTYRLRSGDPMHLHVVFDPSHGYLPRRIRVRISANDPGREEKLKQGMWEEEFEVIGYRQVHDPLQRRERWFPHECRYQNAFGEERLTIDEVVINGVIPIERFRPQPQVGTEIFQGPAKAGEKRKSYIFGGPAAVDAIVQQRVEEARQLAYEIPPGAKLLDARDPGSVLSAQLLFLCSVGLAVAVGVWQFARWKKS